MPKKYKLLLIHCLILIFFSCSLRIILFPQKLSPVTGDGAEYVNLAQNIIKHDSFSYDGITPASFRPPLYPVLISIIYRFTENSNKILFYFQLFLVTLNSIIFYLILREFSYSDFFSLFISLLFSLMNFFTYLTFMSENLYSPLLLISVFLILKYGFSKNRSFSLLQGIFIALTALTRPIGILLIPAIFLNYRFNRKIFFMICIILIIISPWIIRNSLLENRFTFIDNNFGYNLFVGNNPYTNYPPQFDKDFFANVENFRSDNWTDSSRLKDFSLQFILNNPGTFFIKSLYKLQRLYGCGITEFKTYIDDKKREFRTIDLVHYFIIYGKESLICLIFFFILPHVNLKDRKIRFILVLLFLFTSVHMIFFGMVRYRDPLIPFLILLILDGIKHYNPRFTATGTLLSMLLFYSYIIELRIVWFR